eukprot:TRINITY_DN3907_c0_g1_i4.p1 TRINITY_DN3907_c0_g1~~TRINITY_DN3907_c0_g1_i4.p1  ORF type:complete len:274 (-),score=17.21 TRINITY_DN3907_c0_g1_i4:1636-2457(-)
MSDRVHTVSIDECIEINRLLINVIHEYQCAGNSHLSIGYLKLLHQNLMALSKIVDQANEEFPDDQGATRTITNQGNIPQTTHTTPSPPLQPSQPNQRNVVNHPTVPMYPFSPQMGYPLNTIPMTVSPTSVIPPNVIPSLSPMPHTSLPTSVSSIYSVPSISPSFAIPLNPSSIPISTSIPRPITTPIPTTIPIPNTFMNRNIQPGSLNTNQSIVPSLQSIISPHNLYAPEPSTQQQQTQFHNPNTYTYHFPNINTSQTFSSLQLNQPPKNNTS